MAGLICQCPNCGVDVDFDDAVKMKQLLSNSPIQSFSDTDSPEEIEAINALISKTRLLLSSMDEEIDRIRTTSLHLQAILDSLSTKREVVHKQLFRHATLLTPIYDLIRAKWHANSQLRLLFTQYPMVVNSCWDHYSCCQYYLKFPTTEWPFAFVVEF